LRFGMSLGFVELGFEGNGPINLRLTNDLQKAEAE
jgi:hypothetical protein